MDSAQPLYDLAPVARLMLLGVVIALGPLAWVWLRNRHAPPAQRLRVLTLVTLFLTFDLVLFGETNDNGDELPGRVFRPNSDYTLDDTTGDIEFVEPVQSSLLPGQTLWFRGTRLRTLTPFIADDVAQNWDSIRWTVGCYEIEGAGVQLFDRVEGDPWTIIGMPMLPLLAWLRATGHAPQ